MHVLIFKICKLHNMFKFCNNSEMEETTLHNSFDMLIKFELRIKNHIQILSFYVKFQELKKLWRNMFR